MDKDAAKKPDEKQIWHEGGGDYKLAELPEGCTRKIHEFEQDLNRQGYWNIALVAYQKIN